MIGENENFDLTACTPLEVLDHLQEDIVLKCKLTKWLSMQKIQELLQDNGVVVSDITVTYWAKLHGLKVVNRK